MPANVSWLHLAAVLLFLFLMSVLGFFLKNRVKSSDDYWVGGREIGPVTTAFSFCAAYTSTVAVIGSTAMFYMYGMGYASLELLGTTSVVCTLSFVVVGLKMRAVSERINVVSLPGLLAKRFESNAARLICAVLVAVLTVPYGVAALKGIADVLEVIAGVPYTWGVVIISVTALIYMVSSGYWGIAATDLIQAVIIAASVLVLAGITLGAAGGLRGITAGMASKDPRLLTIPGPLPWGLFFSYSLVWALIVFGQPQLVTKYMGLKDGRTMGTVIVSSIIWEFLFVGSLLIIGLGGRHLLGEQFMNNPDRLAPVVAGIYGNTFVSVLFLVGCVAAGLSTVAALVLTSSAAVMKDIYEDGILGATGGQTDFRKSVGLSRAVTGIVIAVTLILALRPWDIVFHISTAAAGTMSAAFTAPTLLGLYWKRATKEGCVAAMTGGTLTCLYWYIGNIGITHPFVPGTLVSFILFYVVSLCTTPPKQETVNIFFKKNHKIADAGN